MILSILLRNQLIQNLLIGLPSFQKISNKIKTTLKRGIEKKLAYKISRKISPEKQVGAT